MLPSVNLRKKRSKSKLSCDFTESPYGKLHSKSGNIKSLTYAKQASPANYKLGFMDSLSETSKFKDFKRNLIDQTFDFSGKLMKPEDYEVMLREKLEKLKQGDSEFLNELELYETVFDEIVLNLKPFEKLLFGLKDKIKELVYKMGVEDTQRKLEKFKRENSNLINKLNSLADINSRLQEDKSKLEECNSEYSRIFKDNPEFLINYNNIVSQMIEQCEVIKDQKKEIKRLKKIEETHLKLIRDLTRSSFFDSSISDESPSMIKH